MKRIIRYLEVLLILMIFVSFISFAAGTSAGELSGLKTFPLSELQEDFKQIKNIIMFEHPKLFTDKTGLEALFNEQYRSLKENMNELEFFRILSPIVSKLNCGHTRLQFSPEFEGFLAQNGRYLPLRVKIIENRAYVWRNLASPEIPPGTEILEINGRPVPDIIRLLLKNMTADGFNVSKKYYEMNHWFSESYFAYIDASEKYRISFMKPGTGSLAEVILTAIPKAKLDQMIREFATIDELDNLPYSRQITKEYGFLKIQSFGFYNLGNRNTFKTFIDEFFQMLAESKASNLILDLRDNWGGDPYCSSYIFQYLIQKPGAYFAADSPYYYDLKEPLKPAVNKFQGNLYILINGASFSSTGHLCSLLKYYKIGTFIGEESGGSYVCTDSSKDITLQNTTLRFHYSTTAFKTAVSGLTPGRGIMPDYTVHPTIEDYIAKSDVEKEFAVDLIQKNKPAK